MGLGERCGDVMGDQTMGTFFCIHFFLTLPLLAVGSCQW